MPNLNFISSQSKDGLRETPSSINMTWFEMILCKTTNFDSKYKWNVDFYCSFYFISKLLIFYTISNNFSSIYFISLCHSLSHITDFSHSNFLWLLKWFDLQNNRIKDKSIAEKRNKKTTINHQKCLNTKDEEYKYFNSTLIFILLFFLMLNLLLKNRSLHSFIRKNILFDWRVSMYKNQTLCNSGKGVVTGDILWWLGFEIRFDWK